MLLHKLDCSFKREAYTGCSSNGIHDSESDTTLLRLLFALNCRAQQIKDITVVQRIRDFDLYELDATDILQVSQATGNRWIRD